MPLHYLPTGYCVIYRLLWNPELHTTLSVHLHPCSEEQPLENTLAQISVQISWNFTLLYLISL